MKSEDYDYVMAFTSHYRAVYMYDRLTQKKIKVKLVTAPNKINISCTQALKKKIKKKYKKNWLKIIYIQLQYLR